MKTWNCLLTFACSVRTHSSFVRLPPRSSLGFPSSAHSGRARSARAGRTVFVGALLALSSCVSREIPRSERIVVEIAGDGITVGEFDRFVEGSVHQDEPFLAGDVMEALFEQFIEEQLLLKAADDAGVSASPDALARRLELLEQEPTPASSGSDDLVMASVFERQLRIEKLVETRLLEELAVSDAEVEAHFETLFLKQSTNKMAKHKSFGMKFMKL